MQAPAALRFGQPLDGAAVARPEVAGLRPAGAARPTTAGRSDLRWPPSPIWLDLYRLLLGGIVLFYFFVLFFVAFTLLDLMGVAWPLPAELGAGFLWQAGFLAVGVVLLVHLGRHLWRVVAGLVTAIHDDTPETLAGLPLALEDYPDLYALVAEVGERTCAPLPDEIRVTYQAECYVTEQRRFSLFTKRQLVLVLGMPHLAVLTDVELRVVVAHELAHFQRGDTTLGVFIYRFLSSLRAAADELRSRWWRFIDPLYWLSLAWFHMLLVLQGPMQRSQELRADRVSAAAYGGTLASRTLLKEWLLSRQFEVAVGAYDPQEARGPRGEPLNVFRWFVGRWREFSIAAHDYLEQRLAEEEQPSLFDSHPPTRSRTQAMRAYPDQSLPRARPAWALLPGFAALEQQLHAWLFAR